MTTGRGRTMLMGKRRPGVPDGVIGSKDVRLVSSCAGRRWVKLGSQNAILGGWHVRNQATRKNKQEYKVD
jgi:hypothetical protein